MITWLVGHRRSARRWRAGALVVLLTLLAPSSAAAAPANLRVPARPPGLPLPARAPREGPVRIVRVTSADPSCGADCPEWISAEGLIRLGAAAAFRSLLVSLKGRRLPVLISSHGGSVSDAVAIGALIREHGLAVAVAHTRIANCPERASQCPDAKGQATADGAVCASACALILAGGGQGSSAPTPRSASTR